MQQRSPLDLRAVGHVDLALVHDLNPDFTASGSVTLDATVRGALDSPQINGRTEFQKAAFNIDGVPNGISKANGVLVFVGDKTNGTRATIQSFTARPAAAKSISPASPVTTVDRRSSAFTPALRRCGYVTRKALALWSTPT
ncbi:MAG: hypothetical protein WDO73_35845 [Ignavibacteriota bacterium]